MKCKCKAIVKVISPSPATIVASNVKTIQLMPTNATANPEDVLEGKIFYNNDGEQVGTLNINLDIMQAIDLQNINYNGGYTMASETDYENALPIFQYWANIIMNGGSYNV